MYQAPYLAATAPGSLMPLPTTQLSHAAALTQFYEYQNAAAMAAAATAPYTSQYPNSFDAYTPYAGAAGNKKRHLISSYRNEIVYTESLPSLFIGAVLCDHL